MTIVFSGCGGGYDIFGCLPLYYEMQENHKIILCNLSFTNKDYLESLSKDFPENVKKICDGGYKIRPRSSGLFHSGYFPKYELANAINHSVYAFCKYNTVKEIKEFYEALL